MFTWNLTDSTRFIVQKHNGIFVRSILKVCLENEKSLVFGRRYDTHIKIN